MSFKEITGLTRKEAAELIYELESYLASFAGYSVSVEDVHLDCEEDEEGAYEVVEDCGKEITIIADVTFQDDESSTTYYNCRYSLEELLKVKQELQENRKGGKNEREADEGFAG